MTMIDEAAGLSVVGAVTSLRAQDRAGKVARYEALILEIAGAGCKATPAQTEELSGLMADLGIDPDRVGEELALVPKIRDVREEIQQAETALAELRTAQEITADIEAHEAETRRLMEERQRQKNRLYAEREARHDVAGRVGSLKTHLADLEGRLWLIRHPRPRTVHPGGVNIPRR